MKKLLSLLLVFVLVLSLCACEFMKNEGGKADKKVDKEKNKEVASNVTESGVEFEVSSCAFDYEIMGIDEESSNWGYTKRDGKVYVNLTLKITNNSEETLNKDSISGYFVYDESEHEMQYNLASVAPELKDGDNIKPGNIGIVNLFSLVDEAAIKKDIVVKYSIDGNEYEEKVGPVDTRDAFSKKTEVSKGDTIDVEGFYEVEIVECTTKEALMATNYEESEKYIVGAGKKIIDLVLKVKNNTDIDLTEISGYTIMDDTIYKTACKIEIDDNTDFAYLSGKPLEAGKEEYIHLYTRVEEGVDIKDFAMRFNLAGNCYYCYVD